MANYCGKARSNYFPVKDVELFLDWANHIIDLEYQYKDGNGYVCPSRESEVGSWPINRRLFPHDYEEALANPKKTTIDFSPENQELIREFISFSKQEGITLEEINEAQEKLELEIGEYTFDDLFDTQIDFTKELQAHVQPGYVAILIEVGSEKMRYLVGQAIALSSTDIKIVDLTDIYEVARTLGKFTLAEY